jgi:hypothetical protein
MPMNRRNADPERDHLVSQHTVALNQLAYVEEQLTEAAIEATSGNRAAFKKYADLTAQANRHRQEAEVFARALEAFDKSRAEAHAAKFKARQDKANLRRKAMIDAMEAEERTYIDATIERLDAQGLKRDADVWREERAKLRETLEARHPPVGTKPKGPSHIVGITNE